MSTVEERKAIVFERIAKREEERQVIKNQRRLDCGIDANERENHRRFYDDFRVEGDLLLLKLNIEELEQMSPKDQSAVFVEVIDGIESLSKRLTESTMFLPSFDIEQSRELIQYLQSRLSEARGQLQPKKKFQFGRRKIKNTTLNDKMKSNGDDIDKVEIIKPKIKQILGDLGISERSNVEEEIVLDETKGKDLYLSDLENCRVRLTGGAKAMRIDKLRDCVVICGPMSGSIFLENCEDCVFVLACQQLRVHSTVRCAFYIHVTSKAIIEFCSELEVAPYLVESPDNKPSVEEQFQATNLNYDINNWDKVDDFCHLAVDVPSSNWKIMDAEKRKTWTL